MSGWTALFQGPVGLTKVAYAILPHPPDEEPICACGHGPEHRKNGVPIAVITVEDNDEGRSVVAKMVAALQMEAALANLVRAVESWEDPEATGAEEFAAARAALEAAKELP